MNEIRIVTDSTADLPEELIEKHRITVVPLKVIFNDEEPLLDGVDIKTEQFYRRQVEKKEYSKTSQPAPAEFHKVFSGLAASGASVISIHLSSALSGTCQSARMAREMLPDSDIDVIDSRSASMGLGLIVLEAARAAASGKTKIEVLDMIGKMISKVKLYFFVDTLEYLARGGRIGRAQALLGTILSIKPLLYLNDGVVEPLEKVRGKSRAIERLAQIIEEKAGGRQVICSIVHGLDQEGADQLYSRLIPRLHCGEPVLSTLGAVIGTHVGPRALGVIIIPNYTCIQPEYRQ